MHNWSLEPFSQDYNLKLSNYLSAGREYILPWLCHITYIIGYCNPSVRIIDLVSHITYVVCVNFMHKWRNIQLKAKNLWKIFMGIFIYSQSFCQKNPRLINCHDVIDVFRSTAIVFLEHFLRPIDTSLTNCVGSNANKFLWQSKMFMQYWMYSSRSELRPRLNSPYHR